MPTDVEFERIALALAALRPDWTSLSVLTILRHNHGRRAYHDLAIAAVACALDPATRTPARLAEFGPWWVAAYAASEPLTERVGPGDEPACEQPGHEHELARHCRACRAERIAQPDSLEPAER